MGNQRNALGRALACAAMMTAIMVCVKGDTLASDAAVLQSFAKAHPTVNESGTWIGNPCTSHWEGVYCINASSRVSILKFNNSNISGPGLAELAKLSALTYLDLHANALTGPIPRELGNLSFLTVLYLSDNALTGPIPAELGNLLSLRYLALSTNSLTGSIPAELGNLSLLTDLSLTSNKLTGPIPKELGKLSFLKNLYLGDNALTGPIPAQLGNLLSLTDWYLFGNQITGSIPAELGSLSLLETLWLHSNKLTGPIPKELGKLSSLTLLWLGSNALTGPIPAELGNLSSLGNLAIGTNALTGRLPKELGKLSSLEILVLSGNALSGPIPAEMGSLSSLTVLDLSRNALTGPLPDELAKLSNLSSLSLFNNSLEGPIPAGLGNTTSLKTADLSQNYLTGAPPGFALARNFSLGLNCFNMNSSHVFEFGQRDPGACDAYYPELTCNCTPPEAVGIDGSCYCVHPLRFTANFTANSATLFDRSVTDALTDILTTFAVRLLSTLRQLAEALDVPYEQLAPLKFSGDENLTVTLLFNILPYSAAPQLTPANQQKIRAHAGYINTMKTGIVTIRGDEPSPIEFYPGPGSLIEEKLVFTSPPPVPPPPPFRPPPLSPAPNDVTGSRWRRSTLIIGTSLAALAVMAAALGMRIALWRRGRRRTSEPLRLTVENSRAKQWTLDALRTATNDFDETRVIGKGGFATVYSSVLGGVTVAVKRLSKRTAETQEEFVKEVKTIGSIHNRNLLPLRGYCIEGDECLLVYDYMASGSLQDQLFGRGDNAPMEWSQCVSILVGTASGIAYLHEGCSQKIIHRDIKPANILLDEHFVPHVADFGLARSALIADTHVSTRVAGTLGYLAPEYALTGQLTEKSDVYSFGVLALVVVGLRPAVNFSEAEGFIGIVERAFKAAADGRLLDLVGHPLLNPFVEDQVQRFLAIALLCTQPAWQQRPTMGRVVQMLKGNIGVPAVDFTAMASYYERMPTFGNSSRGASSTMDDAEKARGTESSRE